MSNVKRLVKKRKKINITVQYLEENDKLQALMEVESTQIGNPFADLRYHFEGLLIGVNKVL